MRNVTQLSPAALGAAPVERDWSEGCWGDAWEYYAAPSCEACGEYARWDEAAWAWRCADHGPVEGHGDEGPMMNYAYPLPSLGIAEGPHDAADRIRDLPLCIVERDGEYELALTGAGMDFSWEICAAYMRLGFLPPLAFCAVPRMAGRGQSERDREIIAACRSSATVAGNRARQVIAHLDRIERDVA